jgi:hypothetical protein
MEAEERAQAMRMKEASKDDLTALATSVAPFFLPNMKALLPLKGCVEYLWINHPQTFNFISSFGYLLGPAGIYKILIHLQSLS